MNVFKMNEKDDIAWGHLEELIVDGHEGFRKKKGAATSHAIKLEIIIL